MSTKGVKKPSNRKKKVKKSKLKSDTNPSPNKLKPKSKEKSKPKSDVLNKLKKKKKKKESTPKKHSKNAKSEDKSPNKIKKKSMKPRKKTFDSTTTNFHPKLEDKSKRKKRRSSNNVDSIKKQLLSQSQSNTSYEHKNMLPNSAKKILKNPPKKNKKQISQVHSMKKTKDFQYNYNYNMKASNSLNPRRAISNMYGFGKKHKKKKTNEIINPKQAKKKKKKSDNKSDAIAKAKKKKSKDNKIEKHKLKKKPVSPSSTEKLSLFRRKPKTKTKKKELLVIGDHVKLSSDKWGVIRYKGCLRNVTGIWYGIELLGVDKIGDCDGVFNGERYFKCDGMSAVFVMYQSIESRMRRDEIEMLLKKKVSKKRSNTMTLSQRLSNQMIGKYNKKEKVKKNKNNQKISSKFSVKDKKNKNMKKKGKISSKFTVTDENGKKIKGKKLKKNKVKMGSNTMGSDKENISNNVTLSLSMTNSAGSDEKKKKYKWDIPSATPNFTGGHISNSSSDMNDVMSPLHLEADVVANPNKSHRHSTSIINKKTTSKERGILCKSDNNLQNILDRGRSRKYSASNGNNDTKSTKKRTRSLSITRNKKKDNSWMTHQNENGNSSDRIKQNILQQKQLDLKGLMAVKSSKKKKDISKLFAKHIENANVVSAKGGMPIETDKNKLRDRLKNEQDALENAIDIVRDMGFLKYIRDNDIYSKIYIKKFHGNIGNESDELKCDYDLFDMNNIDILNKFEGKMRDILCKVICKAIVSIPTIEILEMCNCDIDSDFIEILCDYLINYYETNGRKAIITILSLQSNPISDNGMMSLTKLIRLNNKNLSTIKLQNNRKDISTLICQQICESLECNEYIIKFEFEFRHYQWRDFRDKIIKRNAEKARLIRLEMKKTLSV